MQNFAMRTDSEWRDLGVEFRLVDADLIQGVLQHLDQHFFPDEPLCRCDEQFQKTHVLEGP